MLKNRIKDLISLIEGTEIEEIEVSSFWGAQKIRLNKGNKNLEKNNLSSKNKIKGKEEINVSNKIDDEFQNEISLPIKDSDKEKEGIPLETTNLHEVKAPLVGTYYSSPKPEDSPFINVGDKIVEGQVLCIIEAMKIFNEIESDINGTVKEICIESGNPVEFDQLIIKILPE